MPPKDVRQCPYCPKQFQQKCHYDVHLRVHTGEKPFPCSVCGRAFKDGSTRVKHMRIHTGEKPFKCEEPECGKAFTQKHTLRTHQLLHKPTVKSFQCKICGWPFRVKYDCTYHEKHHVEGTTEMLRPHECEVCHKKFMRPSHLIRHQEIHKRAAENANGKSAEAEGPAPKTTKSKASAKGAKSTEKTVTKTKATLSKAEKEAVAALPTKAATTAAAAAESASAVGSSVDQPNSAADTKGGTPIDRKDDVLTVGDSKEEKAAKGSKTRREARSVACTRCKISFPNRRALDAHIKTH